MEARTRKPAARSVSARPRALAVPAPVRARPAPPATAAEEILALAGFDTAELPPRLRQTVLALMKEKDELRAQLEEARSTIASLERLVDEDPLMPVCNRRAFIRELSRMMGLAGRYGLPGSVVYFDVNNLKQINDAYGHAAGDAALMQVAQTLVESVRTTDVVGRLGGDELGVLLVRTDKALAESKASELAARVKERPLDWHGRTLPLSVAFGVYAFLGNEKAHDVLDAADREMYRHKTGRCSKV